MTIKCLVAFFKLKRLHNSLKMTTFTLSKETYLYHCK